MQKLILPTVLACAASVLGCHFIKKKDDADAAADAATEAAAPAVVVDAAAPGPAAVTAKNSAEIARFPAETAVTDDDAKLAQPAPARTSPKSGSVVATIQPGAHVNKIAEYQGSYLVTFADPKDAHTTMMGWIGKEAFTAAAPVPVARDAGLTDAGVKVDAGVARTDAGAPAKLACPTGMVPVILSKDPVCKKKCTKDAECKTGACANASVQGGGVARVCASE